MTKHPDFKEMIVETPFEQALSERYLAYALSTIMSRSLPDVRDGLKPVHRRLLYAMRLLKLDPEAGFKKCARVVGDVIGKYHPHGDQAIYDAMVRLAQDFSVRYPLVDGQGNFGNIDGDNAAAMRYTEARLTKVARALMDGLDEDAVDFRETYDGEDSEPIVMPGGFPNLLANGSSGIAVGMATSIPPHNVGELVKALKLLIKRRKQGKQDVTTTEIVNCIGGPDFPTGGEIVEPAENIISAYETGRGSFRLRARWQREDLSRGQYQIVITEIPYQVQKSKLIEKIAELISDRRLPILTDVRDESAEEIRIVLEPKNRTIEDRLLMESLFKLTDLEIRFSLNLNVIALDGKPRVLSLKESLDNFLDHRLDVLMRRSNHRLGKIARRLEILSGYLIAYLNLDEVIRIIREEDDAKLELMKTFKLTDTQAEAILNMRLRSLRRLEETEIQTEYDKLTAEQKKLKELVHSQEIQFQAITDELNAIDKAFGIKTPIGRRRTILGSAPKIEAMPIEAMIEKEPITVVLSRRGWIRALKGHVKPDEVLKYKEGDSEQYRLHCQTTDKIFMFTTCGRLYTLTGDKLPGGRGHGEPVRLMVDMDKSDEIMSLFPYVSGGRMLLASNKGKAFIAEMDQAIAVTKGGKQLVNLPDGAVATHCLIVEGNKVAVVGENRKLLVFDLDEIPIMARGQGVSLQRYKDGGLSDIITFNEEEGISWPMGGDGGRTRTVTDLTPWSGKRGNAGRLPPMGFPRSNKFSG